MNHLTDADRAALEAAAFACDAVRHSAESMHHEIAMTALDHARSALTDDLRLREALAEGHAADARAAEERLRGQCGQVRSLVGTLGADRASRAGRWYRLRGPEQTRQAALWLLALAFQVARADRGLARQANAWRYEAIVLAALGEDQEAAARLLREAIDAVFTADVQSRVA